MNTGINRIRLEFKVKRVIRKNKLENGINRIRLEFKAEYTATTQNASNVLIESDWNLKLEM